MVFRLTWLFFFPTAGPYGYGPGRTATGWDVRLRAGTYGYGLGRAATGRAVWLPAGPYCYGLGRTFFLFTEASSSAAR